MVISGQDAHCSLPGELLHCNIADADAVHDMHFLCREKIKPPKHNASGANLYSRYHPASPPSGRTLSGSCRKPPACNGASRDPLLRRSRPSRIPLRNETLSVSRAGSHQPPALCGDPRRRFSLIAVWADFTTGVPQRQLYKLPFFSWKSEIILDILTFNR